MIATPLLPEPVPPSLMVAPADPDLTCRAAPTLACFRVQAYRHAATLATLQDTIADRYRVLATLKRQADAKIAQARRTAQQP